MGACLSICFGLSRDEEENSDTTHLITDPHGMQYGTTGSDSRNGNYIDPDDLRRQRDALERLCQQASNRLINVAPTTSKPDLEAIARDDGPLFEDLFFGYMDREEVKQGFEKLGSIDTKVLSENKLPQESTGPIIHEF